jgi:hypothetical protein
MSPLVTLIILVFLENAMRVYAVIVLSSFLATGCATAPDKPEASEMIAPTGSELHQTEFPWEAFAMRNLGGWMYHVDVPETWGRWQFPFVPVKHPKTREKVPLQRVTSRVAFFCAGQLVRSSAVIDRYGKRYDVLVPERCRVGDRGFILSGSGSQVLTLQGELVLDPGVERIMSDPGYREAFFRLHSSEIKSAPKDAAPADLYKLLPRVIRVDGASYRTNGDTSLAAMITVGEEIGERFLACGGGNVNVVASIVNPHSVLLKSGIALGCAAVGEPQGLFLSDRGMLRELQGGQTKSVFGDDVSAF